MFGRDQVATIPSITYLSGELTYSNQASVYNQVPKFQRIREPTQSIRSNSHVPGARAFMEELSQVSIGRSALQVRT